MNNHTVVVLAKQLTIGSAYKCISNFIYAATCGQTLTSDDAILMDLTFSEPAAGYLGNKFHYFTIWKYSSCKVVYNYVNKNTFKYMYTYHST